MRSAARDGFTFRDQRKGDTAPPGGAVVRIEKSIGDIAMTEVTVAKAQRRLPELLSAAEAGQTVTIRSDEGRIFSLVVKRPAPVVNPDWPGYPYAGSAKGLIAVPADFDEPLTELKEYME